MYSIYKDSFDDKVPFLLVNEETRRSTIWESSLKTLLTDSTINHRSVVQLNNTAGPVIKLIETKEYPTLDYIKKEYPELLI